MLQILLSAFSNILRNGKCREKYFLQIYLNAILNKNITVQIRVGGNLVCPKMMILP